jgi:hypothetical protein
MKKSKGGVGIQGAKVILHHLQGFEDPLFDGDGGNDDDELVETVAFIQFEDRAEIYVRLPRSGFHFDGEVTGIESGGGAETVAQLDFTEVLEEFFIKK